jgi:protein TonB
MLNKIPDREYQRIAGGRIPRGSATISFRVSADGRMSGCRIVRSSGDSSVDSVVCAAATRYLRFSPARDPDGHAVAQDMTYTPSWRPNY